MLDGVSETQAGGRMAKSGRNRENDKGASMARLRWGGPGKGLYPRLGPQCGNGEKGIKKGKRGEKEASPFPGYKKQKEINQLKGGIDRG